MLTEKEKLSIDKFKSLLRGALEQDFAELKLYGSRARSEEREDSDIDLLILIEKGDWRVSDNVYKITADILIEEGISLSPKVVTRADYAAMAQANAAFVRNIEQDGITL